MKYVVTWWERPTGSPADYEAAQKRVLEVFQSWFNFLCGWGEFGGYAVLETDDPAALHRLTTAFAVFQFRVEPVMDVMDLTRKRTTWDRVRIRT